jgi:hypothetical protein
MPRSVAGLVGVSGVSGSALTTKLHWREYLECVTVPSNLPKARMFGIEAEGNVRRPAVVIDLHG